MFNFGELFIIKMLEIDLFVPDLLFISSILTVFKPITISTLLGLAGIVILIGCSALISGSEVAFFSLSPNHKNELINSKSRISNLILRLIDKPKRLLATILISNNFVNIAIVILSSFLSKELFDFSLYPLIGYLFQIIIITSIILLFGEIIPKVFASYNTMKFAAFMAVPTQVIIKVFYPLSSILINSISLIDKRISKKPGDISRIDLSHAIDLTSPLEINQSVIEEQKILKGIVKFGDIEVKEIMKSRMDVAAIDENLTFTELLDYIYKSGFSRIPVYRNNFDNIVGMIHIKDFLPFLGKKEYNWKENIRPAFFVPENKRIKDLLKEFQKKKIHFAFVVDEYGGSSGIVTLEDIIEEIVGEITDEFDVEYEDFVFSRIDENNYVFEAKTSLNDFSKIVNIDDSVFDSVRGEFDTLAGLILELESRIPAKGDVIKWKNFIFKIESVDNRRIKMIRVTLINKNE